MVSNHGDFNQSDNLPMYGATFNTSGYNSPAAFWVAVAAIAALTIAAYSNSFGGPFIFDDEPSILGNSTIRQLWPLSKPLSPPNDGETVGGRPLLNLSFAVNYAIGGTDPLGFHIGNLLIHIAAALMLFGLLRRTLLLPSMCELWGKAATPLAAAVALLWAVHPLQTESVTYIVQRAESLMGLLYLLTLYALVRGAASARGAAWYVVSAAACLSGMAAKEVMVTAPIVTLLYDRTFLAGAFREALRRRWGLYLAFAVALVFMENLAYHSWGRGSSAGFGLGVSPWSYLLMQCQAIVHYLWLCVWPSPLVLDYGTSFPPNLPPLWPSVLALVLLGLATLAAVWRWPKIGFLGFCFFAILAPTSSVIPVATQPMAVHRMYLSLAIVAATVVLGGYLALKSIAKGKRIAVSAGMAAITVLAVILATVTFNRNKDYRDNMVIWADTMAKAPYNSRAVQNMGVALYQLGDCDEAVVLFKRALDLDSKNYCANCIYFDTLRRFKRLDELIAQGRADVAEWPDSAEAHRRLAWLLATSPAASRRNAAEALVHARRAVQLTGGQDPNALDALAAAHAEAGQFAEALTAARKALDLADRKANTEVIDGLHARITLYESEKPYRDKLPKAPNVIKTTDEDS